MADRGQAQFKNFAEFWPYYLRQHAKPETRALHIAGTTVAGVSLAAFLATGQKRYLALALAGSYGPAWVSHAQIELSKPASFQHPLWSLRADLLMYSMWLSGTLDQEMSRADLKLKNTSRKYPCKAVRESQAADVV